MEIFQTHMRFNFHQTNHNLFVIWLSKTRNLSNKVWLKWNLHEGKGGEITTHYFFILIITRNYDWGGGDERGNSSLSRISNLTLQTTYWNR